MEDTTINRETMGRLAKALAFMGTSQEPVAFPAAKVILTVRPAEDWHRSFAATVGHELISPPSSNDPVAVARRQMLKAERALEEPVEGPVVAGPEAAMDTLDPEEAAPPVDARPDAGPEPRLEPSRLSSPAATICYREAAKCS